MELRNCVTAGTTMAAIPDEQLRIPSRNKDEEVIIWDARLPRIAELTEQQEAALWKDDMVDLSKDVRLWHEMDSTKRRILAHQIGRFADADFYVNDGIGLNMMRAMPYDEVRQFYALQMFVEAVHAKSYGKMIMTFFPDIRERNALFGPACKQEALLRSRAWMHDWVNNPHMTPQERIVASVAFEGVLFSSSFEIISAFREENELPGFCTLNEYIRRDEALHAEFGAEVYSLFKDEYRVSQERAHCIFREALDVDQSFIREAMVEDLPYLKCKDVLEYAAFMADFWLNKLGYEPLTNQVRTNPFTRTHVAGLQSKTNLHEKHSTSYQRIHVALDDVPDGDISDMLNAFELKK